VRAAARESAAAMLNDDGVPEPDLLSEPTSVTVWCPECSEHVVITDAHAFLLGLHQRVCGELAAVNGEPD
jgi:hypothetical protein